MSKIWVLKITRCSEDSIRVGKRGNTWDNGDTWDNATWDNSKLKYRGSLRFLMKKCHKFWLTTPFGMNESFLCSL
jgi:hypothetical protein